MVPILTTTTMFLFRGEKGRGREDGKNCQRRKRRGEMGRLSQEKEVGYEDRGGVGGCCRSSLRCCRNSDKGHHTLEEIIRGRGGWGWRRRSKYGKRWY